MKLLSFPKISDQELRLALHGLAVDFANRISDQAHPMTRTRAEGALSRMRDLVGSVQDLDFMPKAEG